MGWAPTQAAHSLGQRTVWGRREYLLLLSHCVQLEENSEELRVLSLIPDFQVIIKDTCQGEIMESQGIYLTAC